MTKINKENLNKIIVKASNDPDARIYLIDKPKGTHSFKAVSVLRKLLNIKKVGFAGTLDPLASGLLILATGKATKLLDGFHFLPKVYSAEIAFGQTSDTYDLEGKIEINKTAKPFDQEYLEKILEKFLGKQKQQVPAYSAVKVKGQKLHHLARQGKETKPPIKEIEIFKLDIKEFKYPNLKLEVTCSAGTYIRSLAYDLGQVTGRGALLSNLKRIAIGDFSIEQAVSLDKLTKDELSKAAIRIKDIINIFS